MDISRVNEDYVRELRRYAESLIKNAESIVGNEPNLKSLHVELDFDTDNDYYLCLGRSIKTTKSYFPEEA